MKSSSRTGNKKRNCPSCCSVPAMSGMNPVRLGTLGHAGEYLFTEKHDSKNYEHGILEVFNTNHLDRSWCSKRCLCCTVRRVEGHPRAGATSATGAQCVPAGGWSGAQMVGQLRLLHVCHALASWVPRSLKAHCPPRYSQSLGLCKLIAQSYFSGNRPGESSPESGLYLSQ